MRCADACGCCMRGAWMNPNALLRQATGGGSRAPNARIWDQGRVLSAFVRAGRDKRVIPGPCMMQKVLTPEIWAHTSRAAEPCRWTPRWRANLRGHRQPVRLAAHFSLAVYPSSHAESVGAPEQRAGGGRRARMWGFAARVSRGPWRDLVARPSSGAGVIRAAKASMRSLSPCDHIARGY